MSGHDVIRNIVFSGMCGTMITVTNAKYYGEHINWIAGIAFAFLIFGIQTFLDWVIP